VHHADREVHPIREASHGRRGRRVGYDYCRWGRLLPQQIEGTARLNPGPAIALEPPYVDEVLEPAAEPSRSRSCETGQNSMTTEAAACSERTCYRWNACYDLGDVLTEESSAPLRMPRRAAPEVEGLIEQLRRLSWSRTKIASELGQVTSTAVPSRSATASIDSRASSHPIAIAGATPRAS
jgi:hypothetical protein